jgi:hypothetical protein
LRFCQPDASIVGVDDWQPTEAYDCAWKGYFGCSRLECRGCKQIVKSSLPQQPQYCRHYECGCQVRDQAGLHVLRSDPDVQKDQPDSQSSGNQGFKFKRASSRSAVIAARCHKLRLHQYHRRFYGARCFQPICQRTRYQANDCRARSHRHQR